MRVVEGFVAGSASVLSNSSSETAANFRQREDWVFEMPRSLRGRGRGQDTINEQFLAAELLNCNGL
jgi:hypothetical protein